MSSRGCLTLVLALLLLPGCGGKAKEPYGAQVKKVESYADQGDENFTQGDLKRASREFNRALDLSRSMDYQAGVARQLNNLGAVALEEGNLPRSRELFTRAYEVNLNQGRRVEASTNQANLATVASLSGDRAAAARHLTLAEDAARQSGGKAALGRIYCRWAGFFLDGQDFGRAEEYLNLAQPLAKSLEIKAAVAHQRGRLALARGDVALALTHFTQALEGDRLVLDRAAMAADLYALGETCRRRRDWPRAFDYFARAFDVYAALGRKARLQDCLQSLQEANREGALNQSLERFEKQAQEKS
jgi:tetratricopeptide (TPR) repeat protein